MATIKAIIVPADEAEPIEVRDVDPTDLDAYRGLVQGNLEVVHLYRPAGCMYINEDGKRDELPINRRATAVQWVHNSAFRNRDQIVGPAFIVGPVDRAGYDTSVNDALVQLLFHTKRYAVEVQVYGDPKWYGNQSTYETWYAAYVNGLDLAERWSLAEEVRVVPALDTPGLDHELRERWYEIGVDNPWISAAADPPFTRDSFVGCDSIEELQKRLTEVSWGIGTAFYYRDLCLIQQVEAGDEWLTIRHGIAFESITFGPSIERGEFPALIGRLLAATKEQCERLEY